MQSVSLVPALPGTVTSLPVAHRAAPVAGMSQGMTPAAASAADLHQLVAALFEQAGRLVHRTAWRITRRAEDAEDVVQSVFTHLLRHPPRPWPESPVAYVHRAAVNAALDILRHRHRRQEEPVDEAGHLASSPHEETSAVSRLEEQRLAARLSEAVSLLSPLEAEVFSLRCFEDLGNHEIASMLGKTPNHVGVTLHSARTKLKAALLDSSTAPLAGVPGHAP